MARDGSGAPRLFLRALFEEGLPAGLTDGQLLERFTTGRGQAAELAFAILVERHGPMILRTARGILRDDHEAMDAFQATFLILVRKGRTLWVRDSLGPWLHRVACRAAGRARAEAGRRRALGRGLAKVMRHRSGGDDRDELAAAVHEELDRLPDRYRVPIVLCDLEGRTCEEAARHLGCPIGTIGSRLARGRERLRDRLARRGLGPAVGTMMSVLSAESRGAGLPAALLRSTTALGLRGAADRAGIVGFSAASAQLAENVLRSQLMIKLMSFGAASVAAVGVGLAAHWIFQPGVKAQAPPAKAQAPPARAQAPPAKAQAPSKADRAREMKALYPFWNDPDRMKNYVLATMGNMHPLIKDEWGVRFQAREAILYKDGTARLWSLQQKDPVATFRHRSPIRELTFFDQATLVVTRSDESVKIWHGLTGALRKELDGQTIQPMWLSFGHRGMRFLTMDSGREAVTVWDAVSLDSVATIRATGTDRFGAAGLTSDGRTVVIFRFGPAPSVELRDVASGRSFATLRPPSSAVAGVFAEGGQGLNYNSLQKFVSMRDTPFWDVVQSLAPTADEPKASPVKP